MQKEETINIWGDTVFTSDDESVKHTTELKCFPAQGGESKDTILILPGGGYRKRAEHEGEGYAEWLSRLGYNAFVLSYRVSPFQNPAPISDAMRAIRYLRFNAENLGISKRVGVIGSSAGGHLAATIGVHYMDKFYDEDDTIDKEDARPDFLILCYAVVSMTEEFKHNGSILNLLGENPSAEDLEYFSNEKHITKDTPPTFLWHTAEDAGVPAQNSMAFAKGLQENNVPYSLHIFPKGGHGLGLIEDKTLTASRWSELCSEWITALDR
ncbi:MAG: alpha/beta hydrolase [Planctomycetota bacterium]|jgi:acetyl esterase/lipase